MPAATGLTLALLSGACGRTLPTGAHPDPYRWLRPHAAARRVQITLVTGYDQTASGLNIDGSIKGSLLFAVPAGWHVLVRCLNRASAMRYSCVLLPAPGHARRLPAAVGIPHPPGGLSPGAETTFAFAADGPARYRLVAATGGVVPVGMWAELKVTNGGRPYVRWQR